MVGVGKTERRGDIRKRDSTEAAATATASKRALRKNMMIEIIHEREREKLEKRAKEEEES